MKKKKQMFKESRKPLLVRFDIVSKRRVRKTISQLKYCDKIIKLKRNSFKDLCKTGQTSKGQHALN